MKIFKHIICCIFCFSLTLPITNQPADATTNDYKIEINKKINRLYLYNNNQVAKTYTVSTGALKSYTPEGTFPMVVKIVEPGWRDIPGGDPKNPLGKRWNGLEINGDKGRTYGIHGTNKPESIGKHVTNGCIRMYNDDVVELYNKIYEGTPVWIHSGSSNNKWRGSTNVGLKRQSGRVTVTSNLNARTGPSLGAFIIEVLPRGRTYTQTGYCGKWYQIKLSSGHTAFIHSDYAYKR